jgi:cobalt-zinc-cadmium efflux system protein
VWTITSGFVSVSAHLHVAPGREQEVLAGVRSLLSDRFGITHSTIQVEPAPAPEPIR